LNKVESAKLVISVGALKSDFNSGNFTYHVPLTATVEVGCLTVSIILVIYLYTHQLHSDHTKIGYAMFPNIKMKYLIPKLSNRLKGYSSKFHQVSIPKWRNIVPEECADTITHAWLWQKLGSFFRPGDVIIAETGIL
jgi:pyruvate decarboxylase